MKHRAGQSVFTDRTLMQNHQSMAKMGRYRQIMGNKNHGKSEFRLQGSEQVQDFGLNHPIQGGDGFVANQDQMAACKGNGPKPNADAARPKRQTACDEALCAGSIWTL